MANFQINGVNIKKPLYLQGRKIQRNKHGASS